MSSIYQCLLSTPLVIIQHPLTSIMCNRAVSAIIKLESNRCLQYTGRDILIYLITGIFDLLCRRDDFYVIATSYFIVTNVVFISLTSSLVSDAACG